MGEQIKLSRESRVAGGRGCRRSHVALLLPPHPGGGAAWLIQARIPKRRKIQLIGGIAVGLLPLLFYLPVVLFQVRAHHFGFIATFEFHRFFGLWTSMFAEHLQVGPITADLQILLVLLIGAGRGSCGNKTADALPPS